MKFSRSFRVPAEDIDSQGHVNNVAYAGLVQNVAFAHWLAVTVERTREKFTSVLTHQEID